MIAFSISMTILVLLVIRMPIEMIMLVKTPKENRFFLNPKPWNTFEFLKPRAMLKPNSLQMLLPRSSSKAS